MNSEQRDNFSIVLNQLAKEIHNINVTNGWYDDKTDDATKLFMIISEVSEAGEGLRNGNPPDNHLPQFTSEEVEIADTIIRALDYAEHKGLRIGQAIVAKMIYNVSRGYKHGGKEF